MLEVFTTYACEHKVPLRNDRDGTAESNIVTFRVISYWRLISKKKTFLLKFHYATSCMIRYVIWWFYVITWCARWFNNLLWQRIWKCLQRFIFTDNKHEFMPRLIINYSPGFYSLHKKKLYACLGIHFTNSWWFVGHAIQLKTLRTLFVIVVTLLSGAFRRQYKVK